MGTCDVRVLSFPCNFLGDPRVVTKILIAGDTEIILNASRISRLQRILIYPHCRLDRNDFRIRSSRTYLRPRRDC